MALQVLCRNESWGICPHLRDEGAGCLTSIPVTVMSPKHLAGEAQTRKIVRKGGLFIKVWGTQSSAVSVSIQQALSDIHRPESFPLPFLPGLSIVGNTIHGQSQPVCGLDNPWGKDSPQFWASDLKNWAG